MAPSALIRDFQPPDQEKMALLAMCTLRLRHGLVVRRRACGRSSCPVRDKVTK